MEGLFPPQITAHSVHSSGRDECRGPGGNVTTHFTGKSGRGSSDTPPGVQACVLNRTCSLPPEWASCGEQPRLSAAAALRSTFRAVPQLTAEPLSSPPVRLALPAVPGVQDSGPNCGTFFRTRPCKVTDREDGGVYFGFNLTRVRWRLPRSADALLS